MEKEEQFVRWFSELTNKDVSIAGGKGASLGEMYRHNFPVPPGFVVTAQAYAYFLQKTKITERIKQILSNLKMEDTEKLNKASRQIREIIEHAELPEEMQKEIVESYEILGTNEKAKQDAEKILSSGEDVFVAVRSSATSEDLPDASFAGQQETFLSVRGASDLLQKVKMCMSSLFTPRAIYYRAKKGFPQDKVYLSVVIQKMINSNKSGVMFSKNPTKNDNTIVIESVWGLGEGIVSGKIKPDHYVVSGDLDNFEILDVQVSKKKIAIIKNKKGENETIKLKDELAGKRVLDTYEIKRLALYSRQLEEHYKKPQDTEFAIDETGIYIVQSRPITTVARETKEELTGKAILTGLGASPGISSGVVKIIHDISELEKVKEGDVLVTEMTDPDMVVSMEKATAIITDEGGITSHAAIVSREMGIPCVVGTNEATKILKDGDIVTVDGNSGKVIAGKGETKLIEIESIVPTKTEIKVIVDLPDFAERAAKSKARAVGLVRLEGIIASGGKHPFKFVKEGKTADYVELLANGIKRIASHFEEIWIRTSDLRSDEFSHLEGSPHHKEDNPMLGDHGVRFSLKHKDIMKAELLAVKKVALQFPEKKLGIMIPQVISVSEVHDTKQLAEEAGIPENILIGIMVETPAAVQIIEDICKEGIKFISFGTNDLTQYTLAVDRNNDQVQNIYSEMHPAVLRSIHHVIKVCKQYHVKTSICGQAASRPEMASFLVGEGIESLSVNADSARKISQLVAEIEKNHPISIVEPPQEFSNKEKKPKEIKPAQMPKKVSNEDDIENIILKELDGLSESPSVQDNKKQELSEPSESIPFGFDMAAFAQQDPEEVVEKILEEEIKDSLKTEWKGERKK
jgi:pyruvate, water dikinase